MAPSVREGLDRVEATVKPGHGNVDLFGWVRGDILGEQPKGTAGIGGEVVHRWQNWSAFGRGTVGIGWLGERHQAEAEIIGGLRGTW